jgi:2-methylcitrate dehydratase PrpD
VSGPTVVEALAERVAGLTWIDLPADVIAMGRRVVFDTIGCALHGATTEDAEPLRRAAAELSAEGQCAVWGTGLTASPGVAALLNGSHAHLRELDDIGGGGHAGASQVPAAFAAVELIGGTGRDLLLGVIAGHEVSSRLADGASYDVMTLRGWHTTGVFGSLGAAAAAARALRLDRDLTANALGLAGSFTGGTWAFMADGADSKRIHPGKASETGLTAAILARAGVTGPRHVLEASWGGLYPTYVPGESDATAPARELTRFRILNKGFKRFPVCWGIASAADAVLALRQKHALAVDDVARVRVTLSEMSRRMIGGRRVATVLDAQMSLPYALAYLLSHGRLTLQEFTETALADPAPREVMERIELVVDPAAHGERQTVEIVTTAGDCFRERVETPVGHWDNPLSDSALRQKFLTLAAPALGRDAATLADLIERLDEPDALPRVRALLRRSPLRA